MADNAPRGTRILRDTTDWESLTDEQVIAARAQADRKRTARWARLITGLPQRSVRIEEHTLALPGRRLRLRVHRPASVEDPAPLILSFHGGAFLLGTPAQNDWLNSYLAARCAAVVVSLDYRLSPEHPLPRPVDDGYDTLVQLVEDHEQWGIDRDAVALLGESAGGTIAALVALRAREEGPALRAQVLTCPVTDWTATMLDHPSVRTNEGAPGVSLSQLRAARRLSQRPDLDPASVSPLAFDDLGGLPPALVVTAAQDPLADHGRRYVERLVADGTSAELRCHTRAVHAFLSMPGLVPAARAARREVHAFLHDRLRPGALIGMSEPAEER